MNFLAQAFAFPAIILPVFIGAALLLALLLRRRSVWRWRDLLIACAMVLALMCGGLAWAMVRNGPPAAPDEAALPRPSVEVDMFVSRGNVVDLFLNDWQHPPERVAAIAGQRHVYHFTSVPAEIKLVRLDPTDMAEAHVVIYSVAVKSGDQVVRQFKPTDLQSWSLTNLLPPKPEEGGLGLQDSSDDPILWTRLNEPIRFPEIQPPPRPSFVLRYLRHIVLAVAALLLLGLLAVLALKGPVAAALNQPSSGRYGEWLMSRWSLSVLVALVAVVTIYLQNQNANTGIGVEVDMAVDQGKVIDLFLNDWDHPPERLPVVPGQRHVYRFVEVPREIRLMRLDPTDLPAAHIIIYGITIRSRNQLFRQIEPNELKTWTRTNLSLPQDENGALVVNALNDDPVLVGPLAVHLPGGLFQWLSPLLETSDSPIVLAIAMFLLVLLARMSTRSGRMQALAIAAACCMIFPLVLLVVKADLLPPPRVTSAVGSAGYNGFDKANEYMAAMAALLVSIFAGWAFARLAGPAAETGEEAVAPSRRAACWAGHAIAFLLVFLFLVPDLMVALRSIGGGLYQYRGWDDQNLLTWTFLINKGLQPMRDFWFPYSGSYVQFLPFPMGTIYGSLHAVLVLWVLYAGLFQAAGRRVSHALVIYGVIAGLIIMGFLPGWNRYLLALDIALLYVGLYDVQRWEWKTLAPFAVFTAYTFFYEPTQVIYAGIGIAVHTVLSAASRLGQTGNWRERLAGSVPLLRQRLLYVGVPMLAGVAGGLLCYAALGMLPGLIAFEKSIGDQGDYGGVPADIVNWVFPALRPDTVFLLLFLMITCTVYRWLRFHGRESDRLGAALIVLSCTTYFAMQKQVLRPHAMMALRLFPFVTLLIFGLAVWRERKLEARLVIAIFLGCIVGISSQRNLFLNLYTEDVLSGPRKVVSSAEALLHHRQEMTQVNATIFAPSHFQGSEPEMAVVNNLLQVCGKRPQDDVYVLGDYALFYILLNQVPPYSINGYNTSPIYEQQRVLDWLKEKKPRFVIWGTDVLEYDSVPHSVRLPLIYTYIVEHYEFLRAVGTYHILVERAPEHAPDLEYWRRILGDRVDLAHVPGLARSSEYTDCGQETARCDAVLTVKYAQSKPPKGKLTLEVASTGAPFRLVFNVDPKEREYVVNLNRVWFWPLVSRQAVPRIVPKDAAAQAVMEYRRERHPVLY